MPHSLTLHVIPQNPLPAQFTEGRHLHALFLNLVQALDPELSALFHSNVGAKAFTTTSLQIGKQLSSYIQVAKTIAPGTPCWWKLCLLDERLFTKLAPVWLQIPSLGTTWHLGPADLALSHMYSTAASPDPWANSCSYAGLYDAASSTEREIKLTFHTPTCFRQGQFDNPLPNPRSVFHTPFRRWQEYADIPLADNLLDLIEEHLHTTHFDIKTLSSKGRWGTFIGCVGSVGYRLTSNLAEEHLKQVNALADYLYFCGTGRKTTMGFGQVNRTSAKVIRSL